MCQCLLFMPPVLVARGPTTVAICAEQVWGEKDLGY
jgi:hypothetical protein